MQSIEVSTSQDGAQKIEFVFDDPLPDDRVTYIEDIASADTPGVAYTIQDPRGVHVCDDVHSFGADSTGTIDVLIPSGWSDPSTPVQQLVPNFDPPVDHPGKIVACGPYKGYVQYSIWGPASDDQDDVRVTLSEDSTRIAVDVQPGTG